MEGVARKKPVVPVTEAELERQEQEKEQTRKKILPFIHLGSQKHSEKSRK